MMNEIIKDNEDKKKKSVFQFVLYVQLHFATSQLNCDKISNLIIEIRKLETICFQVAEVINLAIIVIPKLSVILNQS